MVAKAEAEKLEMASHVQELKKGPWKPEEDLLLIDYVKKHGERDWNMVRKYSGLNRCGKSCRLRWNNHLRPNLRKGPFTPEEQKLIFELHSQIGNKWARIAAMLPGRTDNEIKNFWNTRMKKLARKGTPFYPADIHSPQPDHLAGQSNPSSSPPLTSSASTFQTQPSPTTPTSNSILFPPPHSPTQSQQIHHYDAVLQSSMALYDAALHNSRQQNQQPIFTTSNNASAFQRFKRHRSVPNLTISVPTVRHVTLHPFSPLGFSTTSSPLGQSVSIASSPITSSYMHVTPSPHSYTSSPTGMMISPTALQLGIPAPQPSIHLPPPSPPVVNYRPTSLPRTTSFSFNNMLFDLNPTTSFPHVQQHTHSLDAIDNELAFSVEDLGISMEHDTCQILHHNQSSNHISGPQPTVNNVDEFLRQETTTPFGTDQAEFSAEQATAFLTELENDLEESKLSRSTSDRAEAGFDCNLESMQELELVHDDELSNLLCSTELPQSFWENGNGGRDNGVSQPQASPPSYHFIDDHVLGMEMHQLGSSVPVAAPSNWDNTPGIY